MRLHLDFKDLSSTRGDPRVTSANSRSVLLLAAALNVSIVAVGNVLSMTLCHVYLVRLCDPPRLNDLIVLSLHSSRDGISS